MLPARRLPPRALFVKHELGRAALAVRRAVVVAGKGPFLVPRTLRRAADPAETKTSGKAIRRRLTDPRRLAKRCRLLFVTPEGLDLLNTRPREARLDAKRACERFTSFILLLLSRFSSVLSHKPRRR